jgi:hypothetical protein
VRHAISDEQAELYGGTVSESTTGIRFPIKRSPFWRPLLVLFGATASRSYIDIGPETITTRFGWHRLTIPRERVVAVEPATWPLLGGIGWRSDLRRTIGLIGAQSPVVRFELDPPVPVRLLRIPSRLRWLYVSVEHPDLVRAAVAERS